jgi:LytS/YehU family sensor histidine kinase
MIRLLPSGLPQNWLYIEIILVQAWLIFHNRILLKILLSKPIQYFFIIVLLITALNGIWYWIEHSLSLYPDTIKFSFSRKWLITIVGALAYLSFTYIKDKATILKLQALRKEVELNQLRAQLNPHFLFNSLNAIYGYILQGKEKSGELVLMLSDLLRYITDSSSRDFVTIEEEVTFITNYISFERERLGERTDIQFTKLITSPELKIPTLLLFPIVENAFKYGANNVSHNQIKLFIRTDHHSVEVLTSNQVVNQKTNSTKTGLANTMKRLELIYPGKYTFETNENASTFEVKLQIFI